MTIKVRYQTIDRVNKLRSFKTLAGAQKFAHYWVGAHPEIGCGYAVAGDGIGKITCSGCTLRELFPDNAPTPTGRAVMAGPDCVDYEEDYDDTPSCVKPSPPGKYDGSDEIPF